MNSFKMLRISLAATLGLSLLPFSAYAVGEAAESGVSAETTSLVTLAEQNGTFADSASGLNFTVLEGGKVAVGTGSDGSALIDKNTKAVEIPRSVRWSGVEYQVTAIGENAFCNTAIESVTLPEGLATIGKRAFKFCRQLRAVAIPDSVELIDAFAFFCDNKLASVTFGKNSRLTELGKGVFAFGRTNEDRNTADGDTTTALKTITLPANLKAIPAYLFDGCYALEECVISGKTLDSIGDYAFRECTALKSIDIPPLTSTKCPLGYYAFSNDTALADITFRGDMDKEPVGVTTGTEFAYCTGAKNIYYYGQRLYSVAYTGNHGLQTFAKDAVDWFTVYFYGNQAAAEAGGKADGYVMVPAGTTMRDIRAGVGSAHIHDSENYQPGKGWAFSGDLRSDAGLSNTITAYPCDAKDLANGDVVFKDAVQEFVFLGKPIDLEVQVVDAAGSVVDPSDYDLVVTDAAGNQVSPDQISSAGSYRVEARGNGAYRGTTPAGVLTVSKHEATWKRLSASSSPDLMKTVNNIAFRAFSYATADQTNPDNVRSEYAVVVAQDNTQTALTALSLAGALNAPLLFTGSSQLCEQTTFDIKRVGARQIVVVDAGGKISTSVDTQLRGILGVQNVYRVSGKDAVEAACKVRSVGAGAVLGVKWPKTCFVVSSKNAAQVAMVGAYAYGLGAPVLYTESDGSISYATLKEIYQGGFQDVVLVGSKADVSHALELALDGLTVTRISGNSQEETSRQLADHFLPTDDCTMEGFTVAGENDTASLIAASVLAGRNQAPLLVVGTAGLDQSYRLAAERRFEFSKAWVVGAESALSAHDFERFKNVGAEAIAEGAAHE
ncbi:leucine-rich repeat protein [Adlercreutzia equolifaciens]|uniref:leucine-rich repeat protein n=1 Tax=Adlercreutzia equolifaciens TaxID=446660 RepID=UPI0023AE8058|nr:leucine-rich repeat protein [Adlercreutzia equolifaciens]